MLLAAELEHRYALQERLEKSGLKVVHANRVYGYTHGLAGLRMAPPEGEITFPDLFEGEPLKVLQEGRPKCLKEADKNGDRARCSKALGERVWAAYLRHRGAIAEIDLRVQTRRVKHAMTLTLRRSGTSDISHRSAAGVTPSVEAAVQLLDRLVAPPSAP
jgi:hypothetical protein